MTPSFALTTFASPKTRRSSHLLSLRARDGPTRVSQSPFHSPETPMAFSLTAEQNRQLERILARYPNKMAACIPVLHLCQEANENWVSDEVIEFVSKRLDLSPAHVTGRRHVLHAVQPEPPSASTRSGSAARSPARLRGSEAILMHCEKRLGCPRRRDQQGRQGHAAHRRVSRLVRHGADDAGRQALPRESDHREGGPASSTRSPG